MYKVITLLSATAFICVCCQPKSERTMVFQYSTINALAEGMYESDLFMEEAASAGEFGIGTLEHLDGELIGLEGRFYQITSKGKINEVGPKEKTPFCIVSDFDPSLEQSIQTPLDFDSFMSYCETLMPSNNYIYAFRLDGTFANVTTRSVPRQEAPIRLIEVVKDQTIFRRDTPIEGTAFGYYFPASMKDLNVVGFHFHFLSDDKEFGGHLLGFDLISGSVKMQKYHNFQLQLPNLQAFHELDTMNAKDEELEKIEKLVE